MNSHEQVLRLNKKSGTWYWDYPAVAVICHDCGCNIKRASYSHFPQNNEFHKVLEETLCNLGAIGKKSDKPGRRFVIGNCAEQHAANIFMKHFHVNSLNVLCFSKAMRPRTTQIIDYCDNCKDSFPNL